MAIETLAVASQHTEPFMRVSGATCRFKAWAKRLPLGRTVAFRIAPCHAPYSHHAIPLLKGLSGVLDRAVAKPGYSRLAIRHRSDIASVPKIRSTGLAGRPH